jgi:hypothetical protein
MFPTPFFTRRRGGFAFRDTVASLSTTIVAPERGGRAVENTGPDVSDCGADRFNPIRPRGGGDARVDRATNARAPRGRAPLPESEEPPEPRGHRRL